MSKREEREPFKEYLLPNDIKRKSSKSFLILCTRQCDKQHKNTTITCCHCFMLANKFSAFLKLWRWTLKLLNSLQNHKNLLGKFLHLETVKIFTNTKVLPNLIKCGWSENFGNVRKIYHTNKMGLNKSCPWSISTLNIIVILLFLGFHFESHCIPKTLLKYSAGRSRMKRSEQKDFIERHIS